MPNGDNEKLFGSSLESVDAKLSELEQERKGLADKANKGNLSRKENKRFSELDDIIAGGNEYRTKFQPVPGEENLGEQSFEVDKKVVIGENKNQPGSLNQPGETSMTGTTGTDINPLPKTPIPNIQLDGGQGAGIVPDITGGVGVTTPVNPTNQIVTETLQGIQRKDTGMPDVENEITKATFGGTPESKGYPPVQKPGEAMALLDPSVSMGVTDPILKGNVGGQIIGSQPVFVGGGDFLAFHAINNRKKAIQDAAFQREQEKRDLLNKKPPLVKDQRFQNSLNNQFYGSINGMVDKAKEIYGEDWDLALKDQSNPLGREFIQATSNFDFIAGQADQVTDLMGEIDADLESGDSVFSDETLALRDDYNMLQNDFANGEIGGIVNLSDEFNKLKGFTNLDKIIKDNDIDTKGTLTQYASIVEDDDKYVTTTQKKQAYEDQVRVLAHGLATNQMRDAVLNGYITEEEIFERLNARYGYENIIDKKITTKPTGGGVSVTVDVNSAEEGDQEQKIGNDTYDSPYGFAISSKTKPFNVSGLQVYDKDGNTEHIKDINSVKLNRLQVVKFVNPDDGTVTYKKVGLMDVTTKKPVVDKNGNVTYEDQTTSKMVDISVPGVQSQIKTDAVENFDEINSNLDQWIANQGQGTTVKSEGTVR